MSQFGQNQSRRGMTLRASVLTSVIVGIGLSFLLHNANSLRDFQTRSLTGSVALTQSQLESIVKNKAIEAYWAGPRVGFLYTLDTRTKGQAVIRYIKSATQSSNVVANSRVIATYTAANAFGNTVAAASRAGNKGFRNPNGSVVFYANTKNTDVYLAFPNKKVQIEIYDPLAGQALSLAILQDQITKIGE